MSRKFLNFYVKCNESEVHSFARANVTKFGCLWFVLLAKSNDKGPNSHLKYENKNCRESILTFSVKCNQSEVHSLAEANVSKLLCLQIVL